MAGNYTKITGNSREVIPGCIFVAISGCSVDGHGFIADALEKGARKIIFEKEEFAPEGFTAPCMKDSNGVEWVLVDNSRKALAIEADEFYDHPSRSLKLVGITGTNGKTTTVTLLYDLFTKMGFKCGMLSTIANYVGDKRFEAGNTTSDPVTINSLMRMMADEGCTYCFMEVSSIGAEQYRTYALDFNVGIFSNLTHDHLDYHKTFAEYIRCKKLFFDNLPAHATAITNADDRNGMVLMQNTKARIVTYSCRKLAGHTCRILEESFDGMLLKIDGTQMWCPLIGAHNAYNILAIYCAAIALGADKQEVLTGLSAIGQVRGRLEMIRGENGLNVVIDYAHTPDAMKNVLKTLREIAPSRPLTCLFGCGGDRDRTKRPEMGDVAARLCDRVVLTSDNSRTENTADIIEDIKKGIRAEHLRKVMCIEDRREAIKIAVMTAKADETLLLAGKGHEDYQILGGRKLHFDEREVIAEIFEELKG